MLRHILFISLLGIVFKQYPVKLLTFTQRVQLDPQFDIVDPQFDIAKAY